MSKSVLGFTLPLLAAVTLGCGDDGDPAPYAPLNPDCVYNSTNDLSIWLPPDIDVLKGIYFHNGTPIREFDDEDWRVDRERAKELAERQIAQTWGFALMRGHTWREKEHRIDTDVELVDRSLATFAEATGHDEIVNLPLLIQGASRHAAFGWEYEDSHPGRVIAAGAIVLRSGAPTEATVRMPALVFPGEHDNPDPILERHLEGRAQGALWGVAMMWHEGHKDAWSPDLLLPFFDSMIRARLPNDADPTAGAVQLNALTESEGWLGDVDDWHTIAPYAQFSGDRSHAAWLPNEAMARSWQAFVIGHEEWSAKIVEPTQPRKWNSGFGERPMDLKTGTAYDIVVEAPEPVSIFRGDEDLGRASASDDKMVLEGVRFTRGVWSLHAEDADGSVSRPAGVVVF